MILSIIVPVYKVAQYLRKCVESLLAQNLTEEEYEIILVDDGSPDDCPTICGEYVGKYDNIKVIHQENRGLSAARNSGIAAAKGKYTQFVDADDYLEPDVLKGLVEKMEQDELDVLRFNYQNVDERYEVFEPNKVSKPFVDYRDEVCDGLTFLTERLGYACYAVQFLIRRDLLDDCVFKEGIVFEDTEWTPRLLQKANRVTSSNLIVYNYLVRQGSITKCVDYQKRLKALDDMLMVIDSLKEQKQSISDKRWFDGMIAQIALSYIGRISHGFYEKRSSFLMRHQEKMIFPLSYYHATKSSIRKIHIANISPSFLCFLLSLRYNTNDS